MGGIHHSHPHIPPRFSLRLPPLNLDDCSKKMPLENFSQRQGGTLSSQLGQGWPDVLWGSSCMRWDHEKKKEYNG